MNEQLITTKSFMTQTGLSRRNIERLIFNGKIVQEGALLRQSDADAIILERDTYIGFLEYAAMHNTERFHGNIKDCRNALLTEIELHDDYGLKLIRWDKLISGNEREELYFDRAAVPILDKKLSGFFANYGLSQSEIIEKCINSADGRIHTKKYLRNFLHEELVEQSLTETITAFVQIVMSAHDVVTLSDSDAADIIRQAPNNKCRDLIVEFLNYVFSQTHVKYGRIKRTYHLPEGKTAYDNDTYVALAKCIFNAEYIYDHHMIEKALSNHIYAEMWLYLALFYACGWRASDVCSGWRYLHLADHADGIFGIHKATLHDDLLNDRISDETYINVCRYAIGALEISGKIPSKTSEFHPSPLLAVITPELMTFYGMLTLIGDCLEMTTGDGYMQSHRTNDYQNRANLAHFFGSEILEILHFQNIQSKRLNKDYLQAVESSARSNGAGGMLASSIASYARNHTDLDTIRSYLHDHKMTGEDAATVLYFMMERGVFGWELYQTLITAYPEAMRQLSLKDQTEIIKIMNITPLQLEFSMSNLAVSEQIKHEYLYGSQSSAEKILKMMFTVTQNRGSAKDQGAYCMKRTAGEACVHPEWKSCLANCCPWLIFTKYGYWALLDILYNFQSRAMSGDKRAASILREYLIPRFQGIINHLIHETEMSSDDKRALQLMLEEKLNE